MPDSFWIISANMGLGHLRATFPFREEAAEGILMLGEDMVRSGRERIIWRAFQGTYEFLSRVKRIPVIGHLLFGILDGVQGIKPYYPCKDRSRPTFQVKFLYRLISMGFARGLCRMVESRHLPVVTSFFASAIAVEKNTSLPVYCIICDADINRVWVAKDPGKSRITYFVPCEQAAGRLKQYGVPESNIYLTGFPLPLENTGGESLDILRADLAERLGRLDPDRKFITKHREELKQYLGNLRLNTFSQPPAMPLAITFAVGGAGAQKEIGAQALLGLKPLLQNGRASLNLVAGVRREVYEYYIRTIKKAGLSDNKNVRVIYSPNRDEYFSMFSDLLHKTDVLWTKPSELSFYCALGIPVIIAPPIGHHEKGNMKWLTDIGAGIPQGPPLHCDQWIFDYLKEGRLAEYAWNGFLHAAGTGTHNIINIVKSALTESDIKKVPR